jgi:hypothetical protein
VLSESWLEVVQEIEQQPHNGCDEEEENETISGFGTSHDDGDSSEKLPGKLKRFAILLPLSNRKRKQVVSGRWSVVS